MKTRRVVVNPRRPVDPKTGQVLTSKEAKEFTDQSRDK